jgi:hypothetical protein
MGERYDSMVRAAFDTAGRRYYKMILAWEFIRRASPFALGAAALGGLGYLAHLAWVAVTDTVDSPAATPVTAPAPVRTGSVFGAVPMWMWLLGAALVVVIAWMCRPGQVTTRSERRLRAIPAVALVLLLAGIAGVTLSATVGT